LLRTKKRDAGWSQENLARRLEISQSHLSRIFNRQKRPSDAVSRRIAPLVGLSYAEAGLPDQTRMLLTPDQLRLSGSVVRLAEHLRNSGRADLAYPELGPILDDMLRAERAGQDDDEFKLLLVDALLASTLIIGDLSTEQETPRAIALARHASEIAEVRSNEATQAQALNALGNQQRIGGLLNDSYESVMRASQLETGPRSQCYSSITLARISSERGDTASFSLAMRDAWRHLERVSRFTSVINPISVGEIEVRGLLALGRPSDAFDSLSKVYDYREPVAPQWRIILAITAGEVSLALHDEETALKTLVDAAEAAELHILPHQLQRIDRALRRTASNDGRAFRRNVRDRLKTITVRK
jgi:transcriptional regulator with XRE-family HTH domain